MVCRKVVTAKVYCGFSPAHGMQEGCNCKGVLWILTSTIDTGVFLLIRGEGFSPDWVQQKPPYLHRRTLKRTRPSVI
ncbi:hypothetical protein NDU88_000450 [Pleurodeles waltl]|uniref:Uncharacterized protein n=1 Tax=Pleurodeles waltl TaxID=8319 RepID=A0AAV7KQ00_PLEWA|nr:hypothetical protein NDU88_000450 [Pleurodeles waltl]